MNSPTYNKVGFAMSLVTTIQGSLTCVVTIIIIGLIVYHQLKNQMKRQDRITLILCANIELCLLLCSTLLTLTNTFTLLGDLYELEFNTSSCVVRGYITLATISSLYYGFAVQGFYRLCRIVYFTHRYLQIFWLYLLATPIQFLLSCVLLCPLLVWGYIVYLPNERYCFVPNILGSFWMSAFMYFLPINGLSFMYVKILLYMRRQSHFQTTTIKRRQTRDLLVLRRVLILVGILLGLGVPSLMLQVVEYITGYESPVKYRVMWLSFQSAALVLSVLTIFITPQLKNIVARTLPRNRLTIVPMSHGESLQAGMPSVIPFSSRRAD